MGLFKRSVPSHHVPIHRHNAAKKDWVILLEAGTIVGPSPERLRVARATQERKVVRKYNILLRAKHFLVVDGYDPDKKLVPLQGEEIGRLIAQALEGGVTPRRPWYEPSEHTPDQPAIIGKLQSEFDTVVVELPNQRNASAAGA